MKVLFLFFTKGKIMPLLNGLITDLYIHLYSEKQYQSKEELEKDMRVVSKSAYWDGFYNGCIIGAIILCIFLISIELGLEYFHGK